MQRMLHVGVPSSLHRGTICRSGTAPLKFEDLIRVISEAISLGFVSFSPLTPSDLFITLERKKKH